jgi:hypothetical protein
MAQKAPRDASKEAQKLENRTRLQNQSQKLGATRTKNTRYAAGMVKADLIRVSIEKTTKFYQLVTDSGTCSQSIDPAL